MNGNAELLSGSTLEQNATLACNDGYNISGDTEITCTHAGWSGTAVCVKQGMIQGGGYFMPLPITMDRST